MNSSPAFGMRNRAAFTWLHARWSAAGSGRSIARTFKCYDHKETHNIDGLVTITGGKATTLRAMAEKTADVVCAKLGIDTPCVTKETPLLSYRQYYASPN